jgi:hypothetical protein
MGLWRLVFTIRLFRSLLDGFSLGCAAGLPGAQFMVPRLAAPGHATKCGQAGKMPAHIVARLYVTRKSEPSGMEIRVESNV